MPARLLAARSAAADAAALVSGSAAATSWLTTANEVLQLGATAVAIVAGLYAIKWHRTRIAEVRRNSEQSNRDKAGGAS